MTLDSRLRPPHKENSRYEWAIPLVVLAVAVLSWVPRFTTPIGLRYDGSVYYILGTAAEGQG